MSIKKIFHSKKTKKERTPESLNDNEIEKLRMQALQMSWTYSTLPPIGFSGCFWHFF